MAGVNKAYYRTDEVPVVLSSADVVVIGAGINGLSAAAMLAKKGRQVLVLEREEVPGGAVRTAEVTLPGYRHDLFAMNLGLFVGGPVAAVLQDDLSRHGFDVVTSGSPFCSLFPDGACIGIETDVKATRASIEAVCPDDVAAWEALSQQLSAWAPHLVGLLQSDMPSWKAARVLGRAARSLRSEGIAELMRLSLMSTRALGDENFRSREMKALLASWGMHLDFAPDIPGGALFSYLETVGGQTFGMAIGRGGADCLIKALVGIIEECGGQVRCNAEVDEVLIDAKRARGVRLTTGEKVVARRGVIANVNPVLIPRLLPKALAGDKRVSKVKRFRAGPATMMIHLALSGLPAWINAKATDFNYVHIGPYVDDMAMTFAEALAGRLPTSPTLVVGQPTVTDPSRAPEGHHTLWIQVRVLPGELADGESWDAVGEAYADHVMGILEDYAPGLSDLVLGRCVLTPRDLERYNINLQGGDSLGGSHHPAQFFFLRPVPGWSRHRTPVNGLYFCGAGTWPGGGVGGVSGALVAQSLT